MEGPGPDLVDPAGRKCLAEPGERFDPVADGARWLYAAGDAPEGAGILAIDACGDTPSFVRAGDDLSSPARVGTRLLYVHARSLWDAEIGALTRGIDVVRVAAGPQGVLLVVIEAQAPRLRLMRDLASRPVPLFVEDPSIRRASWR